MKKYFVLLVCVVCVFTFSCGNGGKGTDHGDNVDVGSDFLPENTVFENINNTEAGNLSNDAKEIYPKVSPVKMFMADGNLYYDTGEMSVGMKKCGTLDGNIERICGEYEIPKEDGVSNFKPDHSNNFGWQNTGDNIKEVVFNDGWRIFKRVELSGKEISNFKGCMRISGEEEHIVLTVNDITFDGGSFYPEYIENDKDFIIPVKYGSTYDWGIVMSAKDVTSTGMTLKIKTVNGNPKGELGTGSEYGLDRYNGKFWENVPYAVKDDIAWTLPLYIISEGEGYSEDINWEWLYGELPDGRYRIYKDIIDSKPGEKRDVHRYYLDFVIGEAFEEAVCPYALMHDGVMYYYTGEYIFDDVAYVEADILGTIVSVIPESRMPEKSGEANIPIEGSIYIRHELSGDGILVLIDGKWYIFEMRDRD